MIACFLLAQVSFPTDAQSLPQEAIFSTLTPLAPCQHHALHQGRSTPEICVVLSHVLILVMLFAMLQAYGARIQYLPSVTQSYTARRVCGAACDWCKTAGAGCPVHADVFSAAPSAQSDTSSGARSTYHNVADALVVATTACSSSGHATAGL